METQNELEPSGSSTNVCINIALICEQHERSDGQGELGDIPAEHRQ